MWGKIKMWSKLVFGWYSGSSLKPHLAKFFTRKKCVFEEIWPFICLNKLPQFLIPHILWRNATVRCIILCGKLYLLSIKSNPVAINIPAALCVRSSNKQQRHWIQSFWHSYQKGLPLIVKLGSNLPLGVYPTHLNEIEFRVIFRDKVYPRPQPFHSII